MEWLKKILENTKVTDGKLEVEGLTKSISSELPKHMMPKESFNSVNDQLKEANKTIEDLKTASSENEELQKKMQKYKEDLEAKEREFIAEKKEEFIKSEFKKAGVKDGYINLLMETSKLDDIEEVNGKFVGVEKLVSTAKESYNDLFSDEKIDRDIVSTYEYEPVNGQSDIDAELNNIESIIL